MKEAPTSDLQDWLTKGGFTAVIVVVDINNINEGTSALHDNVLKLKELEKVPILICANKSDTVEGE